MENIYDHIVLVAEAFIPFTSSFVATLVSHDYVEGVTWKGTDVRLFYALDLIRAGILVVSSVHEDLFLAYILTGVLEMFALNELCLDNHDNAL